MTVLTHDSQTGQGTLAPKPLRSLQRRSTWWECSSNALARANGSMSDLVARGRLSRAAGLGIYRGGGLLAILVDPPTWRIRLEPVL